MQYNGDTGVFGLISKVCRAKILSNEIQFDGEILSWLVWYKFPF